MAFKKQYQCDVCNQIVWDYSEPSVCSSDYCSKLVKCSDCYYLKRENREYICTHSKSEEPFNIIHNPCKGTRCSYLEHENK